MAHTASSEGVLNSTQMWNQGDWGMFHELGHNHQWMPSTLPGTTETTCNLYSVKLMTELVGVDIGTGLQAMNTNSRESRTENYFQGGSQISSWSVWTALETYIQVQEAFGWQPITDALAAYYTMSDPPTTDEQEFNRWVMELSQTTGYNLAPYHEAWGFPLHARNQGQPLTSSCLDRRPVARVGLRVQHNASQPHGNQHHLNYGRH